MSKYCTAITKAGDKCPCFAVTGSNLCAAHNPESRYGTALRRAPTQMSVLTAQRDALIARIDKQRTKLADLDKRITELSELIAK